MSEWIPWVALVISVATMIKRFGYDSRILDELKAWKVEHDRQDKENHDATMRMIQVHNSDDDMHWNTRERQALEKKLDGIDEKLDKLLSRPHGKING